LGSRVRAVHYARRFRDDHQVRHILRFLRGLGWLTLAAYFVLGVAWLGLRHGVMPRIDQWRDTVAQQLSQSLGVPVELGAIQADWQGGAPRLTLRDVAMQDSTRDERLQLPYLRATVSWRSLLTRQLQFDRLEVLGLDVTIRRDAHGGLWVLDQALGQADAPSMAQISPAAAPALSAPVLWLLSQERVDFSDITLRWIDEQRQAPPLLLHRATLQLRKRADAYQLALVASPPAALATALEVRADVRMDAAAGAPLDISRVNGRAYARIDALHPAAWQPWLDIPAAWHGGQVWAQASLDTQNGQLGDLALTLRVQQGQWQWGNTQVTLDAARLHVQGAPLALAQWLGSDAQTQTPLRIALQTAGLRGTMPDLFDEPLQFDALNLTGDLALQPDGTPKIRLDDVTVRNADMDVAWQGQWRAAPDAVAGVVDWHGRVQRLQARALARYLPRVVNADARAWLRVGILGGTLQDGEFLLRGDLAHFPFGDDPETGDFSVRGRLRDGVIDYAATAQEALPWPRLNGIAGRVDMRRVSLTLHADRATLSPGQNLPPIILSDLSAHIPNVERDAQLTVQGQTRAPAASYLGLMRASPLGERLDHVFAETSGTGQWELPLKLVVPLLHSRDLTVQGEVRFADAGLQLMPDMPPFEQLRGTVAFTHAHISTSDLDARFLGGVVAVSGGIGANQTGLQFTGRVSAQALRDLSGVQGMQRLQGQAEYVAQLQRSRTEGFSLNVQSDLRGLALDLPAPLGKMAEQRLPLQVRWGNATGARNTTARQQALDVSLGKDLRLRLLRHAGDAPYFHAGALTVRQPMPAVLPPGMGVDVRTQRVDASAWHRVVNEFSQGLGTDADAPRQLLPDLHELRVQADRLQFFGQSWQDARLHAVRPDPLSWRIDVASTQTEGALLWRQASTDAPEHVQAQFDRLTIAAPPDEETTAPTFADAELPDAASLALPALDVRVGDLTVFGHRLGAVSLKGVAQSDAWALESLRIAGAGMQLEGKGLWRLRGAQRGLTLDALATVSDMGAYVTQLGVRDVLHQGQGSIQGRFVWRDLPWSLSLANLHGTLSVKLDKGRLSSVNSRTARLLEVLSIQSLQRLARLDWNLDGLVREGFPFDVLRGDLVLQDGTLHTDDYRVVGPVGTIVISGDADLQTRSQRLDAVVIPNLDVSGAALAAGLAINPVVGVGAFLTQWLLRGSLENTMALHYRIEGSWDDPQIQELARAAPKDEAQSEPLIP